MNQRTLHRMLLAFCMVVLLATFAVGAHWPLVGDSVLMHDVVLLSQHGFAPYREIAEMNLPLTYMSEQVAMRVFGAGDVGWRLYDGALLLATVLLSWRLLHSRGAAAGVFAATLFAAVHLQDGIPMAGQRDLLVTVFEALAGLSWLRADRGSEREAPQAGFVAAFCFGLCGVAAACIKPPALLFPLLAAVWLVGRRVRARGVPSGCAALVAALAGAAVPLLLCCIYLIHFGAVGAFVRDLHGLIAYHARLERRPVAFLLGHVWSPVLLFVLLALAAMLLVPRARRAPSTRVETLCTLGAIAGLLSYVVQGKGFPYQRYPFLLWVLLLCASRLFAALQDRGSNGLSTGKAWLQRAPMRFALLSGVVLMLVFVVRATHFSKADPYLPLREDLRAQNAAALNGRVQCLDTAGTCIGALYKEGLVQSTGFLYDCYLLDGGNTVAQQQRALFEREFTARPPALIVLTDSNCFTGPRTFAKYRDWPWMQRQLAAYRVVLERDPTTPMHLWSRPEMPYRYRLLRLAH